MYQAARLFRMTLAIAIFISLPGDLPASAADDRDESTSATQQRLQNVPREMEAQLLALSSGDDRELSALLDQYELLSGIGLRDQDLTAALLATQHAKEEEKREAAEKEFLGISWGFGVGTSADLSGGGRVSSAKVVDGIVRVEEEDDAATRVVSEVHKLFNRGKGAKSNEDALLGYGLFAAIQSSSDEVIESFGGGFMLGWRPSSKDSHSFNIGVGLVFDPKVQVLGDGITANQPLPGGETEVRFKKEGRLGALLFVSFKP